VMDLTNQVTWIDARRNGGLSSRQILWKWASFGTTHSCQLRTLALQSLA
jgi:hypothetical protein